MDKASVNVSVYFGTKNKPSWWVATRAIQLNEKSMKWAKWSLVPLDPSADLFSIDLFKRNKCLMQMELHL